MRSRRAAPNGSSGPSSRQRPAMSAAASDWSATWSSSPSALARASATSSAELDPSSGEVRVSGCHRTSASRPSGSPPSRAGKAARPGETPPRSVLGTRRGQRAEEHHFGPDRPTRQDGIRPGGGDGWRVAEGEAGEDAEAKRWVCPLEPFPSEAGAATGRGHEGDRGGRAKRGDRPTERDQVAAGRGRHRDHAAEALEVRGRAVVPEDRAQAGFDPARRPAASRRDLPRAQARRAPARPGPHTSSPARAQGAADRLERVCGPPERNPPRVGALPGPAPARVAERDHDLYLLIRLESGQLGQAVRVRDSVRTGDPLVPRGQHHVLGRPPSVEGDRTLTADHNCDHQRGAEQVGRCVDGLRNLVDNRRSPSTRNRQG